MSISSSSRFCIIGVLFMVLMVSSVSSVPEVATNNIALRKCQDNPSDENNKKMSQGKSCETDSLPKSILQSSTIRIHLEDENKVIVFQGEGVSDKNGELRGWMGDTRRSGSSNGVNTLSLVTNGSGGFHGSFSYEGIIYQILRDRNGKHFTLSMRESELPDEGDIEAPDEDTADIIGIRNLQQQKSGTNNLLRGSSSALVASTNLTQHYYSKRSLESKPEIGIMVLWTPRAECLASGQAYKYCVLTTDSEDNMRLLIENAMQQTQTAFTNSQVGATIRLVYASQVDYVENTKNTSETLSRLKGGNDGYMDEIHGLRSLYGADLVSLIIKSYDFGGLSYAPGSNVNPPRVGPGAAFSAVEWIAATGKVAFGHEVAHNLGCHHNEGNTPRVGYVDPMPYGYQDPESRFRTIMAADCTGGCERIFYYSDPDIEYDGMKAGNETTKCAKVITNNAAYYADFF